MLELNLKTPVGIMRGYKILERKIQKTLEDNNQFSFTVNNNSFEKHNISKLRNKLRKEGYKTQKIITNDGIKVIIN